MTAQDSTGKIPHRYPSQPAGTGASPVSRRETATERVNRRWSEMLQETRVAQTGVQILLAFLLTVAFSSRFEEISGVDLGIYVVTVLLAASAAGALIAPVSIHRFLVGHRMKKEVLDVAGRLLICGMMLLALTINGTLLLLLRLVLASPWAEVLTAGVLLWFAFCWYGISLVLYRRSTARRPGSAARLAGRSADGSHRPGHPPC